MTIPSLVRFTSTKSCRARTGLVAGILLTILSATSHPAAATEGALFAPPVSYSTGTLPLSVAIGDLNADGKPDLAVASPYSYRVSVLLGNGDGSFGEKTDYGALSGPHSVAIADLNRDGKPDLAVPNAYCGGDPATVSVLLGHGDGSFGMNTDFVAGHCPVHASIGDLNGDDKPDLAVANYGYTADSPSSVSVLLGNGDGSFGAKTEYRTGDYPSAVAINDLNGDGSLDVAVANYGESTVSILLGDGQGGFGMTHFSTGDFSYPYSVAIGDVNGDGKPDLATANATHGVHNASVLLGNGDGSFGVATRFGTGMYSYFVAIGDLNGDGKPDLAVANGGYYPEDLGSISVLLGHGDGTFGLKTDYGAESRPSSLAIGDLNGDGKPDLAVTNEYSNTVSVLLNTGGAGCDSWPVSLDLSPSAINLGSMGRWVTATLEPEPPASPTDIDIPSILLNESVPADDSAPTEIGDADEDGRPDLSVKFDRTAFEATVSEGDSVAVTVSGKIGSACFEATDVIKVIRARVTAPSAGSELQGGGSTEVRWETPAGVEVESVAVLYSGNDGATWSLVARGLPSTGSYLWAMPSSATDQARIAVVLVESADESGLEVKGVLGTSERFRIRALVELVPTGTAPALQGAVPNPSRDLNVSFTLPDARPTTLAAYDVSGREVSRREVGSLGAGRHVVSMGTARALRPGVYLIHLIRGDRRLVARAAVIR